MFLCEYPAKVIRSMGVMGRIAFRLFGGINMKYLILCKSLTNAQRAALLLERRGIGAAVVKVPQHLRQNGCGYAVSLYRRLGEAVGLLKNASLLTGKIYVRGDDGDYREASVNDLS